MGLGVFYCRQCQMLSSVSYDERLFIINNRCVSTLHDIQPALIHQHVGRQISILPCHTVADLKMNR